MIDQAAMIPTRRSDLVLRQLGDHGDCVAKDPGTGEYFQLDAQGHFLLARLDGSQSKAEICAGFKEQFGQPLGEDELEEFVESVRARGWLQAVGGSKERPSAKPSRQSLLAWRRKLVDPNRFFGWLAPRFGFFWTRGFVVVSAVSILAAIIVLWTNRQEFASSLAGALRWQTALWIWLTLLAVTACHESAHGLTCKHFGGEVHEIGFLLLFFMPCFFCNVSDAWLFREKSKRLWVTFAGGYFELFLWALAVFAWRVTLPGSIVNDLSLVVVSLCGVQTLFNFNPLIKLDGYYLLSDWLEVPNLHQRAAGHLKAHLRRLLWGAPRPPSEPRRRILLGYGLISWLYSLVFLSLALWGMFWFFREQWGVIGMSAVAMLGLVSSRSLLKDTAAGEFRRMLTKRQKRLVAWLMLAAIAAAMLCLVKIEDRVSGPFRVHSAARREVRAPLAGFLEEVCCDEGVQVASGRIVARLRIPDLATRIAQKQSELQEAEAELRLLKLGPRREEIEQQHNRVSRAGQWRDMAQEDLGHMRQVLAADLMRLDKQLAAAQAELDLAGRNFKRDQRLVDRKAISAEQFEEIESKYRIAQAHIEQIQAERAARDAVGILRAKSELAQREQELADASAALALLEIGTRPEQIEAQTARVARLREEVQYLGGLQTQLVIRAPAAGLVTTAHLREKIGQYVREGDLICEMEDPSRAEIEIAMAEQDASRIQPSQPVALKARALPFDTLMSEVSRIAPSASQADAQSSVVVYCHIENPPPQVCPGATGYARVSTGRQTIGQVLLNRLMHLVRTEFWW